MDLELVSTDDLLDEIFSRSDHAVYCAMHVRKAEKGSDELTDMTIDWRCDGNSHVGMGLCVDLQAHILAGLRELRVPDEEEEG